MNRPARLVAAAALFALASPAGAQDGGDKARLDDFALPRDQAAPRVEQLGGAGSGLTAAETPAGDRGVTIPGPPQVERAPVPQLSRPGEIAPAAQLSDRGESRELAAGSVSSHGDSRPQASAPILGSDSCDPQLDTEQRERCLRILERRAAEFSAPEAPRLSAEQVLLAERGDGDDRLASASSSLRLRLAAASDPDAELETNQELASIYLGRTPPQAQPAAPEDATALDDASLVQVLEGLQIDVPGTGGQ